MQATKLGLAIQKELREKEKNNWFKRAFLSVVQYVRGEYKVVEQEKLIHYFPQQELYTDGETFITSIRELAEITSKRGYTTTQFPHQEWEAKDKQEKNSPQQAKS